MIYKHLYGFKYSYPIHIIFKIYETVHTTTTSGQNRPGSNDHEGVLDTTSELQN